MAICSSSSSKYGQIPWLENSSNHNTSNRKPSAVNDKRSYSRRSYQDDLDDRSVGSVEAFWSSFPRVGTSRSRESTERCYGIIRSIKERVVRGYVHDEVQLNDGKIVSQLYTQYIKDTKSLLMGYLGPKNDNDVSVNGWLQDDVSETGKKFAQFLSTRSNTRRQGDTTPSKRTNNRGNLNSATKRCSAKNVRFSTPSNGIERISSIDDEHEFAVRESQNRTKTIKDSSAKVPLIVDSVEAQRSAPPSAHPSQISLETIVENSPGGSTRKGKGVYENVQTSLIEANGPLRSSLLQRKTASQAQTGFVKEVLVAKKVSKKLSSSRLTKLKNSKALLGDGEKHCSEEGHSKSNVKGVWNKSVRLLSDLRLVAVQNSVRHDAQSYGLLGVVPTSGTQRRLSQTPESCRSNSPISVQRQGSKNKRVVGRKAMLAPTKAFKKGTGADGSDRRNVTSPKRFAKEFRHYNSLGVGKVAEVTTVSSFVRYQFDIPDDLDDSLEHLRLHGYLKS